MKDWLIKNYGTIFGFAASIVTWFVSRRHFQKSDLKQQQVNIDGSASDNISKNLDLYQRLFDDLSEKLLKAHETIDYLEEELMVIKKKYQELIDN